MSSSNRDHQELNTILSSLQPPPEYALYGSITEYETMTRLEEWKRKAECTLTDMHTLVNQRKHSQAPLDEQARIVASIAIFDEKGPWTSPVARRVSQNILAEFSPPSSPLLEHLLNSEVKPHFRANPHPSLNLTTGRTLPRPAGGHMAIQDHYEGQIWKSRPGLNNVISWCIRNCEGATYERLWYLLVPPVMTFLDDYDIQYKIKGILLVSEMLERVPRDLLRRTGVDKLLFSSLSTSLTNLHSPFTPILIRAAIPTILTLILSTTSEGSSQRFEQLCSLLGDHIIGSIWMYAARDPETVLASVDMLPAVIDAVGIGCARYLKALVPQLVHPLLPNPDKPPSTELKISSLRALTNLIGERSSPIIRWKGRILAGVSKCWVTVMDSSVDDEHTRELQMMLRDVCGWLVKACPSVVQDEYRLLLVTDAALFEGLVGPHVQGNW